MAQSSGVAETVARAPSRRSLSRERVLRAALDLADAGGIEALSMRPLAHELGVEAMSLYHWFPRKEALLGGMLDAVFSEMELPANSSDWRTDIRRSAMSTKDVLLRHKWAAKLLGELVAPSPARLTWMNSILGRLRAAGLSPNQTHHAYHALDSHIVGFVLWVLPYMAISEERSDIAQSFMDATVFDELPYLLEHVKEHAEERAGDTSEFEFGLNLILDGLERIRIAS